MSEEFTRRYGVVGGLLAQSLPLFSLDLVGVVADYVVPQPCGGTPGAKPTFLAKFGSSGADDGQFVAYAVFGLASSTDGNIWVCSQQKVQVFSADGKFLYHAAKGQWTHPWRIAFDTDTNDQAFITDWSGHCIVVCKLDGSFVRKIGSRGSGNGQFNCPGGIAIDAKGCIFVADCVNSRIQVLNPDGSFNRAWGSEDSGPGKLISPRGLALTPSEVVVCDSKRNRIQIFDFNGKFLRRFGSRGTGVGQFNSPEGIFVDAARNILVADAYNDRIQIFASDGTFITAFGEKGSGPGEFICPYAVAVDAQGRVLVADRNNTRVQVFKF